MKPLRGFIWSSLRWPGGWPSPWVIGGVMVPSFVIAACAASVTAPRPMAGPADVPGAADVVAGDASPADDMSRTPGYRVPIPDPPPPQPPPRIDDPPDPGAEARRQPMVRVVLTRVAPEALVVIKGGWTHQTGDGKVERGNGFSRALDTLEAHNFSVATVTDVWVVPDDPGDLRIGARSYPGRLRIGVTSVVTMGPIQGAATTVHRSAPEVVIDLETYLEGVLSGELPASFPRESQRAQAIVARTYLLSQPTATWTDPVISVDDSGLTDQEFAGIAATAAQRKIVHDAVTATRGQVLFDGARPLRAWYHSICGGHTCPSAPVFRVPATAPLMGVECTTCVGTKYYRWDARIPGAKVAKALAVSGDLRSFRTTERMPGGRARVFEVTIGKRTVTTDAAAFRLAVGPSDLRSTWLDRADVVNGNLVVAGRGWGHGVGMCQWGAKGMADRGATAESIVAHYYPGAEIRRLW